VVPGASIPTDQDTPLGILVPLAAAAEGPAA
jgi:hypothetical protein